MEIMVSFVFEGDRILLYNEGRCMVSRFLLCMNLILAEDCIKSPDVRKLKSDELRQGRPKIDGSPLRFVTLLKVSILVDTFLSPSRFLHLVVVSLSCSRASPAINALIPCSLNPSGQLWHCHHFHSLHCAQNILLSFTQMI